MPHLQRSRYYVYMHYMRSAYLVFVETALWKPRGEVEQTPGWSLEMCYHWQGMDTSEIHCCFIDLPSHLPLVPVVRPPQTFCPVHRMRCQWNLICQATWNSGQINFHCIAFIALVSGGLPLSNLGVGYYNKAIHAFTYVVSQIMGGGCYNHGACNVCGYNVNRVVHSSHFWLIFGSFWSHF